MWGKGLVKRARAMFGAMRKTVRSFFCKKTKTPFVEPTLNENCDQSSVEQLEETGINKESSGTNLIRLRNLLNTDLSIFGSSSDTCSSDSDSISCHSNSSFEDGAISSNSFAYLANPKKEDLLSNLCSQELIDPNTKYIKLWPIGKGSRGTVYWAVDLTSNEEVAIKIVSEPNEDDFIGIETMRKLKDHPNVASFLDSYTFRGELWIVMEYVPGVKFSDISSKVHLDVEDIAAVVKQVLIAVQGLNNSSIVHRGIKAENIIVGMDGSAKLVDFGLCTYATTMTIENAPSLEECDSQVDIRSLGMIALQAKNSSARHKVIVHHAFDSSSEEFLEDFIQYCTAETQQERANIPHLFLHPFIEIARPSEDLTPLIQSAMKKLRGKKNPLKNLNS